MVAVPAGMFPDRNPFETLLLLEGPTLVTPLASRLGRAAGGANWATITWRLIMKIPSLAAEASIYRSGCNCRGWQR